MTRMVGRGANARVFILADFPGCVQRILAMIGTLWRATLVANNLGGWT